MNDDAIDDITAMIAPWEGLLLLEDFAAGRSRCVAGFHGSSAGGVRRQVAKDGISRGDDLTVSWTRLRDVLAQTPPEAVTALNVAVKARQANHYRPFHATPATQGCGRPPRIGPMTAAQALYEAEYDAWHDEIYLPWLRRDITLRASEAAAWRDCLTVAQPTEQLDMFSGAA